MNVEELREYCLAKPGAEESFPFGPDALVFKVMDKMFALLALEARPPSINLKCDPAKAIELREMYPSVQPGYHMSKKHWNTVIADGSITNELIREWIDHSYTLIVNNLPKSQKEKLPL